MRRSLLTTALIAGTLLVPASAASASDIVISEFRTRGPAGGNDEFVEIRNTSAAPVAIGGLQLQGCASGTGSIGNRATVSAGVTLAPGQTYLFTNIATPGPYSGTVARDQSYNSGFTDFAASNQAGIRIASASDVTLDQVGSTVSPCREGTGLTTPGTNGDNSFERIGQTQDTDNNVVDFAGPKAGNPENFPGTAPPQADDAPEVSSTDPSGGAVDVDRDATLAVNFSEPVTAQDRAFALSCDGTAIALTVAKVDADSYSLDPQQPLPQGAGCTLTVEGDDYADDDTVDPPNTGSDHTTRFTTVGATGLRIHDIQGAAHLSPHEDDVVTRVPGIVTAVRTNGFYLQDPNPDDSNATSEGVFVFTNSAPTVAKGQSVEVSGRVAEFRAGCEPTCAESSSAYDNLTITEIEGPKVYAAEGAATIAPTLVGAGGYEPPQRVTEDDALGNVEIGNVLFDPEEDGLDWHESLEGMLVDCLLYTSPSPRDS